MAKPQNAKLLPDLPDCCRLSISLIDRTLSSQKSRRKLSQRFHEAKIGSQIGGMIEHRNPGHTVTPDGSPCLPSRRPTRARPSRVGKHRCIAPPTSVKCARNPRIAAHSDSITRNKTNKSHGSDATMEDATMEKGIFEGLKVLDCASFIAAPAAATVLSDFGADLIKIEPPVTGDPYRNLPNLPGYPASPHNSPGCWSPATRRALLSTSPSRTDRRSCIASLPRPTSSLRIFRPPYAAGSGSRTTNLSRSMSA